MDGYVRIYRPDNESLNPRAGGLCDVLHIDMQTDATAEKSTIDEVDRVCARITKLYTVDVQQLKEQLRKDINYTMNEMLPLTGLSDHVIHRQEYAYIHNELNADRPYVFIACFVY